MSRERREVHAESLLGKLNEIERKFAPEVLYVEGDISLLTSTPCVSVVGTRDVSEEGKQRTRKLVRLLVEHGVTVVSGLARGVDSIGHRAAIELGGRTIAVLGTPLNRCTPVANRELLDQIKREHLAISQFPEGSRTSKWCFPARNRTMALVSQASVIVEAAEKSGTLSQGWEAIRLNRQLFIMKSNFERPGLTWPHQMLKYGAMPLAESDDLDELFGFLASRDELRSDTLFA